MFDKCYAFIDAPHNFLQAEKFCESLDPKSHLPIIKTDSNDLSAYKAIQDLYVEKSYNSYSTWVIINIKFI